MRPMTIVPIAAALAAAFFMTEARAQPRPCLPYGALAERLAGDYGEMPVWYGVGARGGLLEIWANPTTRSWTALEVIAGPEKRACLVGAGPHWDLPAVPLAPAGAPS